VWADIVKARTCADCLAETQEGLGTGAEALPYWKAKDVPAPAGVVQPIKFMDAKGDDMKKDAGKVGLHLLPFEALEEIAKVLDFGAQKYASHKWREGMKWSRLLGALLRHTFAWARGQDTDPETGRMLMALLAIYVLFHTPL
jgi:hypothetical protein